MLIFMLIFVNIILYLYYIFDFDYLITANTKLFVMVCCEAQISLHLICFFQFTILCFFRFRLQMLHLSFQNKDFDLNSFPNMIAYNISENESRRTPSFSILFTKFLIFSGIV